MTEIETEAIDLMLERRDNMIGGLAFDLGMLQEQHRILSDLYKAQASRLIRHGAIFAKLKARLMLDSNQATRTYTVSDIDDSD